MSLLVIDNYDSFIYNLVHACRKLTKEEIVVARNDEIELDEVERFNKIMLSPGPGIPSEAGIMPDIVKRYGPTKKILGVCLGHQCIAENYGAELENMADVCHGKAIETQVRLQHKLFWGVPGRFESGRYHSWTVRPDSIPNDLDVLAVDPEDRVMALAHREHDVVGVQFHPESILTPVGAKILENWLR